MDSSSSVRETKAAQKLRYKDTVRANLQWCHIKPKELEERAMDRPRWKASTHKAAANYEEARHHSKLTAARDKRHREAPAVITTTDFQARTGEPPPNVKVFIGSNGQPPPYHTVIYRTLPHHTVPYGAIPYFTVLCRLKPPYSALYCTIPYHTIPYHTVLCRILPYFYRTIPYHNVSYCTILYCTLPMHDVL